VPTIECEAGGCERQAMVFCVVCGVHWCRVHQPLPMVMIQRRGGPDDVTCIGYRCRDGLNRDGERRRE